MCQAEPERWGHKREHADKSPALTAPRLSGKADVTRLIAQLAMTVNDLNANCSKRREASRRTTSDFSATGQRGAAKCPGRAFLAEEQHAVRLESGGSLRWRREDGAERVAGP